MRLTPRHYAQALLGLSVGRSAAELSKLVHQFAAKFVRAGRQRFLPKVLVEVRRLAQQQAGVVPARISVASDWPAAQRQSLEEGLAQSSGMKVDADWHQDSALLGGVVVRFGDSLVDGSLRQRLLKLRESMRS